MSFQLKISGNTSNNQAEVDVDNNLKVNLPLVDLKAGFTSMIAENDAGTITGTRYMRAPEVSSDFRLRTAQDNMVFNESFPGAAFNTGLWSQNLTTMTATVASGFASLNAGLSVASAAVARLQTWRHFPIYKTFTTMVEMEVQFAQVPQTSNVCEWGIFISTGTTAPTDGAFFRLTAAGEFRCVLNNNGVEVTSVALDFTTLIGVNITKQFLIYIGSTSVRYWIDNILVAEILTPDGQGSSVASMNLPMAFRNYNSAATSLAQVMKVGNINVTFGDQGMSKPWGHVLSGMGAMATQGQTGGTMGSTAIYTNAAAAAAAALSNTTAAVANTGLGGIVSVLPTLVAGTDGILFSYQVPVGTAAYPGKSLYVTGAKINSVVTTVLAGGPVIYAFSIAYGHTAVSLATTESGITKAPRRLPLGMQSYLASAAVGIMSPVVENDFMVAPICVQPGEFIQFSARNLGTVTTTGVITFVASLTGYWE